MKTAAKQKQSNEDYHIACQNCGTTKQPLHIIPLRNDSHVVGLIHSCDECDDVLKNSQFDRPEKLYASQNTLDREKVMEILDEYLGPFGGNEFNKQLADAICSFRVPEVSEDEIKLAADEYEKSWCDDDVFLMGYVNEDFIAGAKWMKELLTPKER